MTKRKADKKAGFGQGSGSKLVDANIAANFPKSLPQVIKVELRKLLGKEMGGEVMDMTKAQLVGMMDGGKVKKMNMGGVIGGRGGKFKGMM